MARGGALVFKGDAPKKKSTKKKHSKNVDTAATEKPSVESKQQQQQQQPNHSVLPPVIRLQQRTTAATTTTQQQEVPTMKEGTGGITTSGTVVTGVGTLFEKELNQGDAIIIGHGESQEMRVVTMRLSNTSCAISSSFRDNCKLPTRFHVIRKPRNKDKEAQEIKEQHEKLESTQNAFGTYQGDEFVYRERTEHGNYRIKRGKVDGSTTTTRGDLLHMRAQKTSDKYC